MDVYSPLQPCPYCEDRVLPHVMARHILRKHPEKRPLSSTKGTAEAEVSGSSSGAHPQDKSKQVVTVKPDSCQPNPAQEGKSKVSSTIAMTSTNNAAAECRKRRQSRHSEAAKKANKKRKQSRKKPRAKVLQEPIKNQSAEPTESQFSISQIPYGMIECLSCGAVITNTREARRRHVREEHNHRPRPEPEVRVVKSAAHDKGGIQKRKRFWVRIVPGGLPSLGKKR